MWRKLLIGTLSVALAYEVAFAAVVLLASRALFARLGIAATPDTLFLGDGLGWCLVFISIVCAMALHQVHARDPNGFRLTDVLGWWWIVVGIAIFARWGKIDNLFTDSLKGALLVFFSYRARRAT